MNEESREARLPYGTTESTPQYTFDYEPIRGYPELRWTGKRPFRGTTYFPAQLKESHGDSVDGWRNKLYWGDNLQVMSHLLREYRGEVNLIYIDPPFDSKADYKKKIELRGVNTTSDASAFEEKQYTDIWTNDEYLQFMYERLILMKELLSENGSIYVHCDSKRNHYLKSIMDEVFGIAQFASQIAWKRTSAHSDSKFYGDVYDTVLFYSKSSHPYWKQQYTNYDEWYIERYYRYIDKTGRKFKSGDLSANGLSGGGYRYSWKGVAGYWRCPEKTMAKLDEEDRIYYTENGIPRQKQYLDEMIGLPLQSLWDDILPVVSWSDEQTGYPTQKPEDLLERIILSSSKCNDIVFDCFMGSGTTQAVAMKLGRRFLGADINLGAIHTTSKRLLTIADELKDKNPELRLYEKSGPTKFYTGFEVFTVNHYDFFRNELEARELLIEALELQKLPGNMLWDGEKDGWMVKILAVNRLATAADLNPILGNLDYKTWERRSREHPDKPVERIKFVCMGHDPDLKAQFLDEMAKIGFKVELEVLDILRDRKELQFKREAEAKIVLTKKKLEIRSFYPMNLLQKLSLERAKVGEWRELVDSVLIDWNYDGAVFSPSLSDIPDKNTLVKGTYDVPDDAGTVRVKITDLIAESWEGNVEA